MSKYTNCSEQIDRNKKIIEEAFSRCWGESRVRLNGRLVGLDEARHEIFIKEFNKPTRYLSVFCFAERMTETETREMERVPFWNGNNAYEVTAAVLGVVESVFSRGRVGGAIGGGE